MNSNLLKIGKLYKIKFGFHRLFCDIDDCKKYKIGASIHKYATSNEIFMLLDIVKINRNYMDFVNCTIKILYTDKVYYISLYENDFEEIEA